MGPGRHWVRGSKVPNTHGTDRVKEAIKDLARPGCLRAIKSPKVIGSQSPAVPENAEHLLQMSTQISSAISFSCLNIPLVGSLDITIGCPVLR